MVHPALYVGSSTNRGRGVFTYERILTGTLVEVSPVIVMSREERLLLDKTLLHDYIFEWGHDHKQCCMALGYLAVYNHSFGPNCEYEMDFDNELIRVKTIRRVEAGEELFINYNGDGNNNKPLWFEVK